MKKVIVSLMMLTVLAVGSVVGAEARTAGPGPMKGGVKGSEHGTIQPFEHGSIVIW